MDDVNGFVDRELNAFLGREASRRTVGRRSDRDVVAAIVTGRAAPLRLSRALVGAATAALGLALGVVVMASGLFSRPAVLPSASPSVAYQAPFGLPKVPHGGICPVTDRWLIGTDALPMGAAVGGRPVYAFLAESGSPAYYEEAGFGWKRIDVLWVGDPGFSGQVTLSAARLDGPGDVSLGDIPDRVPLPSLELDAALATHAQPIGAGGWTALYQIPILVDGPGCYGLRIDTDRGATFSVFEARPVEEAYRELEGRPLRLPTVASGQACMTTPTTDRVPFVAGAVGDGPIYLAGGGGRAIWVADSRELGPIIVRGGRIDGQGSLAFAIGSDVTPMLRLPIHSFVTSQGQPPGWRQFVTSTLPSSDGCYAAQIDTLTGSEVLIFNLGG
jgi:hypothetical protein